MNFKKAISAALSSLLLLASIPSYAAPAASEKIPYDTFETYGSKLGGGWRVQGADTTAPIVETEKGKSVMGVTSPGGMLMCGKEAQKQNRYRQSPRAIP